MWNRHCLLAIAQITNQTHFNDLPRNTLFYEAQADGTVTMNT